MSWGEEDRSEIERRKCGTCGERSAYFMVRDGKYLCYDCYWKSPEGKIEIARREHKEYHQRRRQERREERGCSHKLHRRR